MRKIHFDCDEQVCPKFIELYYDEVEERIYNVIYKGGCAGGTAAIASLSEGQHITDVLPRLQGINCGQKGTSCPNELAKLLRCIRDGQI
jgi:uncharacterized protein (TIGR03905 family)